MGCMGGGVLFVCLVPTQHAVRENMTYCRGSLGRRAAFNKQAEAIEI